jgi:beta-glucosidase
MDYSSADFGPDFQWGVTTAAYQTEGGTDADGKGKSIWDVFTSHKGHIHNGDTGNTACDFYHRYKEDISIISCLSVPNFRFSVSWSRILPQGTGEIQQAGIDYYNRVINYCLELDIEPWITLYHWDLPYELEKKGGWTNRDVVQWFSRFVEVCIRSFGDRVKNWIILNEPMAFTGAGYFLGVHAPGRKGLNNFLSAVHHAALCQAEGGRVARSLMTNARIGTTFSSSLVVPYRDSVQDTEAALRVDTLLNRTFIEPLLGLGYPVKDLKFLQRLETFIKDGDEASLSFEMDFIGLQNYTREVVCSSWLTPWVWAKIIKAEKRGVEITEMKWEVYPQALYEMLKKFSSYAGIKELIVTENGAAFRDILSNGRVPDEKRRLYLEDNIGQVLRARREGVNVSGYFVWSLTDNFEWAEGYHPRFGLVHINFETQQRIIKDSGYWYGKFITSAP